MAHWCHGCGTACRGRPDRDRAPARPTGCRARRAMPPAHSCSSGCRCIISRGGVHVGHRALRGMLATPLQPKPLPPDANPVAHGLASLHDQAHRNFETGSTTIVPAGSPVGSGTICRQNCRSILERSTGMIVKGSGVSAVSMIGWIALACGRGFCALHAASVHAPREAAKIRLLITSVSAERLGGPRHVRRGHTDRNSGGEWLGRTGWAWARAARSGLCFRAFGTWWLRRRPPGPRHW